MNARRWWMGGLLAGVVVAALLSPHASPLPDGLDHVAERLGFRARERTVPLMHAPLVGYKLPVVCGAAWSTSAAGVAGTLIVFGGVYLLGFALTRRRSRG
jgi:cobalt/nickel transport protein